MRNAEDQIQAAIVAYLRACVPNCLAFAVPNGGLRSKREAARLKWTGTLAGVTDLVLLTDKGAFFIEVKTATGRVSREQDDFMADCRSLGFGTAIVRSIDDVRLALKTWNIPTKEVAS